MGKGNELTDEMRAAIHLQLTAKPKPRQRRARRGTAGLWVKPFASDALGVNPRQIPEARAHLRAHGITAEFDSVGRCIVTGEKQYRDVAKATGMWDGRDGWNPKKNDGMPIETGRTPVVERRRFERALERGDFDF